MLFYLLWAVVVMAFEGIIPVRMGNRRHGMRTGFGTQQSYMEINERKNVLGSKGQRLPGSPHEEWMALNDLYI